LKISHIESIRFTIAQSLSNNCCHPAKINKNKQLKKVIVLIKSLHGKEKQKNSVYVATICGIHFFVLYY